MKEFALAALPWIIMGLAIATMISLAHVETDER